MTRLLTAIITVFVLQTIAFSQSNFSKEITLPNGSLVSGFFWGITSENELTTVYTGGLEAADQPVFELVNIIRLDGVGGIIDAHSVYSSELDFFVGMGFAQQNNKTAFIFRAPPTEYFQAALIYVDIEEGVFWANRLSQNETFEADLDFDSNGNVLSSYYYDFHTSAPAHPKLGLILFDKDSGVSLFNYYYYTQDVVSSNVFVKNVLNKGNSGFSILGYGANHLFEVGSFIFNIDNDGNIISSFGTSNPDVEVLDHKFDSEGNLIIIGRHHASPGLEGLGYTCFLGKYNEGYELIWAKEMVIETFPCYDVNLDLFPDDGISFLISSIGDFPTVFGRYSVDGVLEWHQGYGFNGTKFGFDDSGNGMIGSLLKFLPDGSVAHSMNVTTLDGNGDIPNCPQFTACVEVKDFILNLDPWHWNKEPGSEVESIDLQVDAFDLVSIDYCGSSVFPAPTFSLSDTICQYDCIIPDELQNSTANFSQWYLTGPNIDSTIIDTTFNFCFSTPGEYTIEQEVWLLGCSEIFQRELIVLPELEASFNSDAIICGDPPFELEVISNSLLIDFEWSTGEAISVISISEDGNYAVTVSDGYCESEIQTNLSFLNNQLMEEVIQLPSDTSICEAHLPYQFIVESPYTNVFKLLGTDDEGFVFELSEAGVYSILTVIEGCPFISAMALEVDPCLGELKLPNAFTPNNDGLNDTWCPLGPDIETVEIKIFDRWGQLQFEASGAEAVWDGNSQSGTELISDTYVALVYYRNRIDDEIYSASSEVTLLR